MNKKYILYSDFYKSKEWQECRKLIKLYNKLECLKCGSSDNLCVDHIKSKSRNPKLMFQVKNLQLLCGSCNKEKGHLDFSDYRTKEFKINVNKAIKEKNINIHKLASKASNCFLVHNYPKKYKTNLKLRNNMQPKGTCKKNRKIRDFNQRQRIAYQLRENESNIDISKVLELQSIAKNQ